MKILMVLDSKFPPDIRVEKEAFSLIEGGYQVGLLSIADYDKSEVVRYKGIKIYRTAVTKFTSKKMHGLAAMIPWIDYVVAKKVLEIFENESYDAIHLHDLYLFGAASILRKKIEAHFIGDLHENYIDVLKDYKWSTTYPNKLFISFSKWKRKEKEWLKLFDRIIVVNEGMRDRNIAKGVEEKKITVVSNSIDTDVFDEYEIDKKIIKRFEGYFTLVYVGGFVSNRGLEHVIKGMKELKRYNDEIRLLLVGDGEMMNILKDLAKRLEVEDVVIFEGWQPQEKIRSYLEASDVGLVPFKRTPQTDNSSSNKLYQYMYCGLPILATNCTSVEKLVIEEECGIIYEEENTDQFVENVIELYKNDALQEQLTINGGEAIKEKYNWNIDAEKLVNVYKSLEIHS
ncbi:MAG: glycosyltransferase family 4 protein [Gracilimonas sp.]|uniref:glycosyltransferase family 4 protein n=1 Tax=Gracilimonas sp. TaxID=1974203 RepID=UPI003753B115|nr:glycosyltransferase family 4 protein [Gracilimonas sp.]